MTTDTDRATEDLWPAPAGRWALATGWSWPVLIAAGWLAGAILIALLAGHIAPFDPAAVNLGQRLHAPIVMGGSVEHLLGTDHLGRDVLSRLVYSVRYSLLVAFLGTFIGAILGTLLGFTAAHFKGLVDDAVMVLVDFQASMPFLVIALAILAFLGNSFALFVGIMGLHGWERYARLTRGLALSANERGYAMALRTVGAGPLRIYLRHILPNIASVLVVNMTLGFPEIVLWESALSFLGLGLQPPLTSLGSLLAYGRNYLLDAWWLAVLPGLVIVLTTLSVSMLGDELRDRLDPTLRRSR